MTRNINIEPCPTIRTRNSVDWAIDPGEPLKRRRRLGRGLNYQAADGTFKPASSQFSIAGTNQPTNLATRISAQYASTEAPLFFWAGDADQPLNRATIVIAPDEDPSFSIAITAVAPDNVVETQITDGNKVIWPNFWKNADLEWTHGSDLAKKVIRLTEPGHNFSWRFKYKLPPGATYTLVNNILSIFTQDGRKVFSTKYPYGHDANGPIRGKSFRCSFEQIGTWGPENQWPICELSTNPDDFDSAVYPIEIDPTVTKTGSSEIEDNTLIDGGGIEEWGTGGSEDLYLGVYAPGGPYLHSIIMRTLGDALPGGITAIRLYLKEFNQFGSATGSPAVAYQIASDNNDWEPGTENFAPADRSCSGYKKREPPSVEWAGGYNSRCGVIGTDILAEGGGQPESTPDLLSEATGSWYQWDIPVDWDIDVAGVLLKQETETDSCLAYFRSTDYGTANERPYFEIDYSEGGVAAYYYNNLILRGRR